MLTNFRFFCSGILQEFYDLFSILFTLLVYGDIQ